MQLDKTLGQAPNNTTFRGQVNIDGVKGITTSEGDAVNGTTSTTRWEGTQSQITNGIKQAVALGYAYSARVGATSTLEVHYPVDIIAYGIDTEPDPIIKWEINNQQELQNLYECKDRDFLGKLVPKDIQAVENQLRTQNITQPVWGSINNDLNSTICYDLKKIGVEGRKLFVPILKRTIIASNNYLKKNASILRFDNTNFLKVFMTGEIVSNYSQPLENPLSQIPSITLTQMDQSKLPGRYVIAYNINGIVTTFDITTTNGYVYDYSALVATRTGWLQYPVDVQTISPLKQQLSQQWEYGRWSCDPKQGLYDSFGSNPAINFTLVQQQIPV